MPSLCVQSPPFYRYLSQLGCHSQIASVLVWSVKESLQDAIDPLLDSAAALLYHAAKTLSETSAADSVQACRPFLDMVRGQGRLWG